MDGLRPGDRVWIWCQVEAARLYQGMIAVADGDWYQVALVHGSCWVRSAALRRCEKQGGPYPTVGTQPALGRSANGAHSAFAA
jgi:hypothetical protein